MTRYRPHLKEWPVLDLVHLRSELDAYMAPGPYADTTRKNYDAKMRIFERWCEAQIPPVPALPADPLTVEVWLAERVVGRTAAAIGVEVAAVRASHWLAGHRLDLDPEFIKGLYRSCRPGERHPADALTIEAATLMVADRTWGLDETRMRAVVLLVHAAGNRAGGCGRDVDRWLTGLRWDALCEHGDGIALLLPSGDTLELMPCEVPELCPVTTLRRLRDLSPSRATKILGTRMSGNAQASAATIVSSTSPLMVSDTWSSVASRVTSAGKRGGATTPVTLATISQLSREDLLAVSLGCYTGYRLYTRAVAALLVGLSGALRASDLLSLRVEDALEVPEGLVVRIRRSKGNQMGALEYVGIPRATNNALLCPVAALKKWLALRGVSEGRMFDIELSSLNAGLRDLAKLAAVTSNVTSHSMRRGFVTELYRRGASLLSIAATSRHKKLSTVWRYVEPQALFVDNPAAAVL